MNRYFDIKRFSSLLLSDLYLNLRTSLIALVAVFGVLVIALIGLSFPGSDPEAHFVLYTVTFVLGGIFIASAMFAPLNDPRSAISFLTLPASSVEKYGSRFLVSTFGVFLGATLIYEAAAIVAALIVLVFGGGFRPDLVNPFTLANLEVIQSFLVMQTWFLFGSVYFRRHSLIKTLLSFVVFVFLMAIITFIFARLVFFDQFDGWQFTLGDNMNGAFSLRVENFFEQLVFVGEFVGNWLMAPFFLILGVLRLRETEV